MEREINCLLQGSINQQTASRQAHSQLTSSADTGNSVGADDDTVPQRDISEDDICPICQEELLAKHQPVTFCRSDAVL